MSDYIDRQAAIDAVINADYKDCGVLVERRCRKFEEALRSLPTAQAEIIRCKDCKHRDAETAVCEGRGWPMQLVPDDGFCDKGERKWDR